MNIKRLLELQRAIDLANKTDNDKELAIDKTMEYTIIEQVLIECQVLLINRCEAIMEAVRPCVRHADKKKVNDNLRDIQAIRKRLESMSEVFDGIISENDEGCYDRKLQNAYEILRLILFYYTRATNEKAAQSIGRSILKLQSNGIFSDEEITSFQLRR